MPSVIFDHKPQVSRYYSIELFQAIAHIFVQILVAQVHYLDWELAAKLPQTRDDSQKLSSLAVASSKDDPAATIVEAGV